MGARDSVTGPSSNNRDVRERALGAGHGIIDESFFTTADVDDGGPGSADADLHSEEPAMPGAYPLAAAHRSSGQGSGDRDSSALASVGDVEAQEPTSIARFPGTLAGMAEVAKASRERHIDLNAIAALINKRPFGPRALHAGEQVSSHDEVAKVFDGDDVTTFMRAAGLSDHDIDEVKSTSYKSGVVYPSATLLGTVLQYVVVPVIGLTHGSTASFGASAGFVVVQIGSAAAAQPAVITLSEHLAKGNGPFIEVDKDTINYKVRLTQAAREAQEASETYTLRVAEFQQLTDGLAAMSPTQLADYLASVSAQKREELRQASTAVTTGRSTVHAKQQQLFTVQGGLQRQQEGAFWQMPVRVFRAPISTLLGLFSGVSSQSAADTGLRAQTLSPLNLFGLQAGVNMLLQGLGHGGASWDEYNKVRFKTQLNVMYADLFNDIGRDQWGRGEPVTAAGIDAGKVRGLFSSPPEAIGKVVRNLYKTDVKTLPAEQGEVLQRELDLLQTGQFDQLDPRGAVARTMIAASGRWGWLHVVAREALSKYTWPELKAQLVQRFNQTFHGGVFGSGVATLLPRGVAAHFGGSSHLTTPAISGLAVASTALAAVGAISQSKSTVQKNNNKEGEPAYSLSRQIGEGMSAGYLMVAENRQATSAGQLAAAALIEHRTTAQYAQDLVDHLDNLEQTIRHFQELPYAIEDLRAAGFHGGQASRDEAASHVAGQARQRVSSTRHDVAGQRPPSASEPPPSRDAAKTTGESDGRSSGAKQPDHGGSRESTSDSNLIGGPGQPDGAGLEASFGPRAWISELAGGVPQRIALPVARSVEALRDAQDAQLRDEFSPRGRRWSR
ncbi:hypothetical protein [Mycobacterium sp. ACS1612]|uniref:hypothetical protein n=1 Tax=Mycobacterium sp. ACS1612 TaxID=1834117 RepID=UPI0012EAF131|nr:hypothetical protein [Mycobacterium sp. ACS1612]